MDLNQWFAELDEYQERIPLPVLTAGLKRLSVDLDAVRPYMQFSHERYRRNLMHQGPSYHALILCWRKGQASPIHDHRGSSCAVRVLCGQAVETVYEMTEEGWVFPVRTRQLCSGFMCATQDLDIHQLANGQAEGDLVTLHIYSPPLLVMGQYSLTDPGRSEFKDEVYAFAEGAGI